MHERSQCLVCLAAASASYAANTSNTYKILTMNVKMFLWIKNITSLWIHKYVAEYEWPCVPFDKMLSYHVSRESIYYHTITVDISNKRFM